MEDGAEVRKDGDDGEEPEPWCGEALCEDRLRRGGGCRLCACRAALGGHEGRAVSDEHGDGGDGGCDGEQSNASSDDEGRVRVETGSPSAHPQTKVGRRQSNAHPAVIPRHGVPKMDSVQADCIQTILHSGPSSTPEISDFGSVLIHSLYLPSLYYTSRSAIDISQRYPPQSYPPQSTCSSARTRNVCCRRS